MEISLKYLVPIDVIDFCIHPVGGLLETKEGPAPDRINDTLPSFWKPRSILEPTGLLTDDNVSWYWIEIRLSPMCLA